MSPPEGAKKPGMGEEDVRAQCRDRRRITASPTATRSPCLVQPLRIASIIESAMSRSAPTMPRTPKIPAHSAAAAFMMRNSSVVNSSPLKQGKAASPNNDGKQKTPREITGSRRHERHFLKGLTRVARGPVTKTPSKVEQVPPPNRDKPLLERWRARGSKRRAPSDPNRSAMRRFFRPVPK